MHKYDYLIINVEISARLSKPGDNICPIDLTIVSQNIEQYCDWKLIYDCGNSVHFSSICTMGNGIIF